MIKNALAMRILSFPRNFENMLQLMHFNVYFDNVLYKNMVTSTLK